MSECFKLSNRKKVGTITFHAAHNYGSNLQAWALQQILTDLGVDGEIINYRTEAQKDQYTPLTKRKGVKYILKNGYFLLNYRTRKAKYLRFENFIEKHLVKSEREYSSLEVLMDEPPQYDYYISGSDQIWNTAPNDASDAYFLPFVKEGKRIAYAPSFGQIGNIDHKDVVKEYLERYDVLSVREESGQALMKDMLAKDVPIMPDPTLLIQPAKWEQLTASRLIEADYIFFYTLFATKEMIDMVKQISAQMGLPVVISNISNQYEIFSGFRKIRDAGPCEFLSLVKHAKFVCVTSFHGTVFSILFHKNFFAINGMSDKRISTLLKQTNLTEQAVTKDTLEEKLCKQAPIDYGEVDKQLRSLRNTGVDFLKKALELGE